MSFLYLFLNTLIISCDITVDGYSPALAPHITYASKISQIKLVDVDVLQFWGRPRHKQEIIDHVSNAVFTNNQRSDQWVEVLNEEPPVRLSDSCLFCYTYVTKISYLS